MKFVLALVLSTSFAWAAVNDAEIINIVQTVDGGEVSLAHLALKRSTDGEIKNYANHMLSDHSTNSDKYAKIAKENELNPAQMTQKSVMLKKENEATHSRLSKLKGREFDKAYIDAMVADHRKVLATLNQDLIPAAKDPDLKATLTATKERVGAHLNHAEKIQDKY